MAPPTDTAGASAPQDPPGADPAAARPAGGRPTGRDRRADPWSLLGLVRRTSWLLRVLTGLILGLLAATLIADLGRDALPFTIAAVVIVAGVLVGVASRWEGADRLRLVPAAGPFLVLCVLGLVLAA